MAKAVFGNRFREAQRNPLLWDGKDAEIAEKLASPASFAHCKGD